MCAGSASRAARCPDRCSPSGERRGPGGPGTREGAGGVDGVRGVDGGTVGGLRELGDVTSALGCTSLTIPVGQLREPRPVDRQR